MIKNILHLGLFIAIISVIGCDKNRVYEKNIHIPDYRWKESNIVAFQVEIIDTQFLYDLFINVRHASHYPFQNLWVNIYTTFPSGKKMEKPLELILADKRGKWHGDGLGDIWDLQLLIQENAYFNEIGTYKFELGHNMRRPYLPGIMEIGFRVENTGEVLHKKRVSWR